MNIIETIYSRVRSVREQLPREALHILSVWNTEYVAKLGPESSTLHLTYVCVATNMVGSCYYERDAPNQPKLEENVVGRDIGRTQLSRYLKIAAHDAVYGNLIRSPDQEFAIKGNLADMTRQRAKIVCDEVQKLADKLHLDGLARPVRVANVGVVGDFIYDLVGRGFDVSAVDHYDAIVGNLVHGVEVQEGPRRTPGVVRDSDIAVVTGMTLANDTLDELLAIATSSGTKIVIFAQTGSNFAEVYLEYGASVVVAEDYPFYLSATGQACVRVYRSESGETTL